MHNEAAEIIRQMFGGRGIRIADILLFGSRARGDAGVESDWDFLVLTENDISFADRKAVVTEVQRKLAALRIPNDIVIRSVRQFDVMKGLPDTVSAHALREGVHV